MREEKVAKVVEKRAAVDWAVGTAGEGDLEAGGEGEGGLVVEDLGKEVKQEAEG